MEKASDIPLDQRGQSDGLSSGWDAIMEQRDRLFAFIKNKVSNWEEAEDLLQDVFYQVAGQDDRLDDIDHMASWMFTIARNRVTDFYRKKKAEPFSNRAGGDENEDWWESFLPEERDDPESLYLRSMVQETLEVALDELPEEQKDVFVLHELQRVPFSEIEKMTGVGKNTLLSRKRYAVLHLRSRLQALYDEMLEP
ncbi:MAG: RNA polymerase sigma factor [Bacteroidota bacterium]